MKGIKSLYKFVQQFIFVRWELDCVELSSDRLKSF